MHLPKFQNNYVKSVHQNVSVLLSCLISKNSLQKCTSDVYILVNQDRIIGELVKLLSKILINKS